MSIYIFTPSGSGGSQDWQSTLSVGSVLGQNNTVDVNNFNFNFENFNQIRFGADTLNNYLTITKDGNYNTIFCLNNQGLANYFFVDPKNEVYALGDYLHENNGTSITIFDTNIDKYLGLKAVNFAFSSMDYGNEQLQFNGSTGFFSSTGSATPQGFLKIYCNGALRYIQLYGT